jgi:hypothetical protein
VALAAPPDHEDQPKRRFRPPIRREAPETTSRGLSAVEASRAERNKIKRPPLKVILWFVMIIAVGLVLYFRWESNQVESSRQKLLTKQREAVAVFGQQWQDIRTDVERWTAEIGGRAETDHVDKEALAGFDVRNLSGIYLRLRKDQATDSATIKEAAMASLRDGFSSCLVHNKAEPPTAGAECKDSTECEVGQFCNEYARCAKPGQPYNLRLAYRAFSALSPEFEREVREAPNGLTLRALDLAFEDSKRIDLPIAADLLAKAQFFLVVVDERPPPVSAPTKEGAEAAPSPDDVDAAAGVTYPSRVGLYRLSDKKLLLRVTRDPKIDLKLMTGRLPTDSVSVSASIQRQAHSCALANEVKKAAGYAADGTL